MEHFAWTSQARRVRGAAFGVETDDRCRLIWRELEVIKCEGAPFRDIETTAEPQKRRVGRSPRAVPRFQLTIGPGDS